MRWVKQTFLVLTKILYGYGISSRVGIGSRSYNANMALHCITRDKIPIEKYISRTHEIWINYMLALECTANNCITISFDVCVTPWPVRMCLDVYFWNNFKHTNYIVEHYCGQKISNAVARHLFYMLHLIMWIVCSVENMHACTHTRSTYMATQTIILIHFHICTQRTNRP